VDAGQIRDIKRLMAFARKIGAKKFACSGFEIEFQEGLMPATRERVSKLAKSIDAPADKQTVPAPERGPTLQEINDYIYGDTEERH
jgi:hypothetical protein